MSLVWINGQLVDKSEAKISVFDHGFLYGDGVWEHFRAFNGKVFRPEWGFITFVGYYHSLEALPFTEAELTAAIERTLEANNRREGYVRAIVTRGVGTLGPDRRKLEPQVIIIAEEYRPFPDELYAAGLNVISLRDDVAARSRHLNRTLNQWHIAFAKQCALRNGCLEAILTDNNDRICYGTEGDLYLVQGGCVHHAFEPSDDAFWRGFNMDMHRLGQPALGGDMSLSQLLSSDEAFLAGTSCGIIGIVQVDGQPIGSGTEGPITRRIREAYRKLTRGEL